MQVNVDDWSLTSLTAQLTTGRARSSSQSSAIANISPFVKAILTSLIESNLQICTRPWQHACSIGGGSMRTSRRDRTQAYSWVIVAIGFAACALDHPVGESPAKAALHVAAAPAAVEVGTGAGLQRWSSAGHDPSNSRSAPFEWRISARNAGTLTPKWIFQTDGDVWVTPALADDAVYFPDATGNLFALRRQTGELLWQHKISDYTGVANDISRNTPAIAEDTLVLGDQAGRHPDAHAGAHVIAVRRSTGELLWSTQVDMHDYSLITQSPVVYRGVVYVGVSSLEEMTQVVYQCCSFRGSVVALSQTDGHILWKTSMQPDVAEFAGAAVWGSTPVIDPVRNSVYVTTGNNYLVPKAILECQTLGTAELVKACVDSVPGSDQNHFDSVVALDMQTGAIKWAQAMVPFDTWNIACVYSISANQTNCTDPHGEDYDFAQGPTLFTVPQSSTENDGHRSRQLLGAGQKSGMYWALNPDDGSVVWSTQVGPGGSLGGMEWGSATDGKRIYVAISNTVGQQWTLSDGTTTRSGFWSALDAATGKVLWQTGGTPMVKSSNQGQVSVANGVVYAGTVDVVGTMYALDAATGATLWTFASGGSVNSGPAIVDGTVYWGSGYGVLGMGITPNNKMYAFVPSADCKRAGASCLPIGGAGGASASPDVDGGVGQGGAAAADGVGSGTIPSTWSAIYAAYLGPGTIGHCGGCHFGAGRIIPLDSPSVAYQSLQSLGQISGTSSPIGQYGRSRLTWMAGDMPPNGPTSAPDAVIAISAWVAAGALEN
jgi:polyvinyl alcohol dehydrogenase (cytochrome)